MYDADGHITGVCVWGYSQEFLVGPTNNSRDVPLGSSNPNPISDQKVSFSTPVFRQRIQTRFQTYPLGRNVIIASKVARDKIKGDKYERTFHPQFCAEVLIFSIHCSY